MHYLEHKYRKVPEYYPSMYQDGFTPDEIMYALRRKMLKDYYNRTEKSNEHPYLKIESEIKIK